MSMKGRKNLQAQRKASVIECRKYDANTLAKLIENEHESHRLLKHKPMKFQFNQMNQS